MESVNYMPNLVRKYVRDKRSPVPKNKYTSKSMSSNKNKNTKPELLLRKELWKRGIRGYRLHPKNIPGKPDLAFIGKKYAIFVHGCFWHHHNCPDGHYPKSNKKYWKEKISNNMKRDKIHSIELQRKGWKVKIVWECELTNDVKKQIDLIIYKLYGLSKEEIIIVEGDYI